MKIKIYDQSERSFIINQPVKKVVSLVPSVTETLIFLGLKEQMAGRTKFCLHPQVHVEHIPVVGGTKSIDIEKVIYLNPDLIIGSKEENEKEQIITLAEQFPVYVNDVIDLPSCYNFIEAMGNIFSLENAAQDLIFSIRNSFENKMFFFNPRIIYLIWHKPFMTIGKNTFIDSILKQSGLYNIFGHLERYPQITEQQIQEAEADYILLSTEPYPFNENHCREFEKIFKGSKVMLVDGEMFAWYGSHLLKSASYFQQLKKYFI